MARKQHLPDVLSPSQVIALQDALLANANRLLEAALRSVEAENLPLARSLAILGMEESGMVSPCTSVRSAWYAHRKAKNSSTTS